MPNQRAKGHSVIALRLHRQLLYALDHACYTGRENRSKFIRRALRRKLQEMAIPTSTES